MSESPVCSQLIIELGQAPRQSIRVDIKMAQLAPTVMMQKCLLTTRAVLPVNITGRIQQQES